MIHHSIHTVNLLIRQAHTSEETYLKYYVSALHMIIGYAYV